MSYEIIKGKIAENGNREDIPLEQDADLQNGISYDIGYAPITSAKKTLGGLPANRDTLNEFFYITSSNLFAFQNGEFPTFNANALQYMTGSGYPLDAILWCEAEGRFVKSSVANNNYNFITTPSYIGSYWVFLNDDEVSDITTGLTLTNTSTGITVSTGFVKSATSGRILKLTSSLNNLWSNIQSNSSLTPSANSKYNLYLAYNPSTTTYAILASSYTTFVPSLPSGYTEYALLGYMSTDNNVAVNNVYPNQDLNDWYLLGGANRDRLTRFCANSGNLDSNGEADLMSVSGSTITWKIDDGTNYKPLVCTPANELISFTLTGVNNFDASTLANGSYTICINKNGHLTAMGSISGQNYAPTSPSANDIWVNTAIEPLNAYYYSASSWVALNDVPLAEITVSSGSITASSTLPYNKNYYLSKEFKNMLGRIDYANAIIDIELRATSGGQTKTYTMLSNGYIHPTALTYSGNANWYINDKKISVSNISGSDIAIRLGNLIPVSKGDIFKLVGAGSWSSAYTPSITFTFYPQKQ